MSSATRATAIAVASGNTGNALTNNTVVDNGQADIVIDP